MARLPSSIPGVVDVVTVRGRDAARGARPDLLIEIPHGATRTADFDAMRRQLRGPFPADLVDFFHANTDAGAPELGLRLAALWTTARPRDAVALVLARIPRTFVDMNRVLDASPAALAEGKVTPGLPPYVEDAGDRALLTALHARYADAARAAFDHTLPTGKVLLLHTYAPRSVDVQVDAGIGAALRAAWSAEHRERWPLRPPIDLIGRDKDGARITDAAVLDALRTAFAALAFEVGDSATYPLHPSTAAWTIATAQPARVACVEVRRDLLTAEWLPFAEMRVDRARVDRIASALLIALTRDGGAL
jgi:hypothetical protein